MRSSQLTKELFGRIKSQGASKGRHSKAYQSALGKAMKWKNRSKKHQHTVPVLSAFAFLLR